MGCDDSKPRVLSTTALDTTGCPEDAATEDADAAADAAAAAADAAAAVDAEDAAAAVDAEDAVDGINGCANLAENLGSDDDEDKPRSGCAFDFSFNRSTAKK